MACTAHTKNLMRIAGTIISILITLWVTTDVRADRVDHVVRAHQSDRDTYSFRTDRKLIGAELEVYSTTGEKIVTRKLRGRRVAVDFSQVRFGEYIIRITATGRVVHEHWFLKK